MFARQASVDSLLDWHSRIFRGILQRAIHSILWPNLFPQQQESDAASVSSPNAKALESVTLFPTAIRRLISTPMSFCSRGPVRISPAADRDLCACLDFLEEQLLDAARLAARAPPDPHA